MSMNLHPPGFVETAGGCSGPRYTRSQPSRETAGITLNECQTKYISEFQLPYRNISRYIKELEQSWDKLTKSDKQAIIEDLNKNLPSLAKNTNFQGPNAGESKTANPSILSFLRDYISTDPKNKTKELLDGLYYPSESIKQAISESKRNEMRKGVDEWSSDQSLYFHSNIKTFIFLLFMILLFFVLGITIGINNKKK